MVFSSSTRSILQALAAGAVVLLSAACNTAPAPTATPAATATTQAATAVTQVATTVPSATQEPTAIPATNTPEAEVTLVPVTVVPTITAPTSTPAVGQSTVKLHLTTSTGAPIANTIIYLARVYKNSSNTQGIFALDITRSPKSTTLKDGTATFAGVEAGDYVLVVGTPGTAAKSIIFSDAQGQAKLFQVDPDKVTDLGTLRANY